MLALVTFCGPHASIAADSDQDDENEHFNEV